MRNRSFIWWIVSIAFVVGSVAALGGGKIQGTVTQTGWGKFILKDLAGTTRTFHVGKGVTGFEPDDWWRPKAGDEVTLEWIETTGRSGVVVTASSVKLLKPGPNTVKLESPVEGEVVQGGRSAIQAKVRTKGKQSVVRFQRGRDTTVTPMGWVAMPGEKVRVEFTVQPSRFMFGINYVASKIEKLD